MENYNLIRLTDIGFGYPGQAQLFSEFNFNLTKGNRVGITGPNGCGKTTLFNLVMGFAKPASGRVEIFGKVRKKEKDFQEVRQRIGFLFQNSDDQLFCPSVREEVAFGLLNYRVPKEEIAKRIKETLSQVGLEGFEDRAPYHLSEGEKKKLALATVLVMKPKILLLDEPTNGLDEETEDKIVQILNTQDISYVVISQDKEFLKKTTNIFYTISNGRMRRVKMGIRQ